MSQKQAKPFALARISIRNHKTGVSWTSPKPMRAFVDSGSTHTIFPLNSIAFLKSKLGDLEMVPAKIETIGGQKDASFLKGVSFCLNKACVKGDVLVTDGISGDILVGSDFLTKAKCKMDFEKKLMRCGDRDLKFRVES